jgi:hypothetical protein
MKENNVNFNSDSSFFPCVGNTPRAKQSKGHDEVSAGNRMPNGLLVICDSFPSNVCISAEYLQVKDVR